MIRKCITALLCILLTLPVFKVSALEKSIEELSEETSVSNSKASIVIPYGESQARVYFGKGGINIFTGEERISFETNYGILKLIAVGDIDKDGYVDFLTYQDVPGEVAQLMCLSGQDGHVISAMRETRDGYDNNLGANVRVNCFIQQLVSGEDGTAYVVCDYSIIHYDLSDGHEIGRFTDTDNIWKIIWIDDINGDGVRDLAYSGQQDIIGVVDSVTMERLKEIHPAGEYEFTVSWDNSRNCVATFNMWDLRYEEGLLYGLSENGRLYVVDLFNTYVDEKGEEIIDLMTYDLEVVEKDSFDNLLSNHLSYLNGKPEYMISGILDWSYMGYRFADSNDTYLLINTYMGDSDTEAQWVDGSYPAKIVLFNKMTGEVETRFVTENAIYKYQKTCFGVYEEQPVIAAINHLDEGTATIGLYDLEGKLLTQKEIESGMFGYEKKMEINWDGEQYLLEVYDGGAVNISANLKKVTSAFSSSQTEVLEMNDQRILTLITDKGIKNRIVCLEPDGRTVKWEYTLNKKFSHKGFEYIGIDSDYNRDGVNDIFLIVNNYDNKDNKVYSQFIVVNGKDGKALVDKNVITATYYDENWNKVTQYLTGSQFNAIRDIDGDGKWELEIDGNVVSSNKNEVIGSSRGYIETDGMPLEVGDCNGDGFQDYVVITKKETRLYTSKYSYSYGMLEVSYTKTGSVFPNPEKADAMYTSAILGDINGDGVKEIGMVDYNAEGRQIFKVINGKTLYSMFKLCKEGVKGNGEAFKVSEFDFNNDGYYELIGRENWVQGIYDGKTGELVFTATDDYWKDEYYADFLVPFTILEYMDYNFVGVGDVNGDGCEDFAFLTSYDNEDWQWVSAIRVVSGADYQTISDTVTSINDYESGYGNLLPVEGIEGRCALVNSNNKTTKIFDLIRQREIMGYSIEVSSISSGSENQLLAVKDKKLYSLDTKPSFSLNTELPEITDNYKVELSWDNVQDYSVMTVYDNGNVVYKGSDNSCSIRLMEGKHSIRMSMDDGQGKIYSETRDMEVTPQPKNYTVAAIFAAVSLLLALLLGIFHKIRIRSAFRKEVAR